MNKCLRVPDGIASWFGPRTVVLRPWSTCTSDPFFHLASYITPKINLLNPIGSRFYPCSLEESYRHLYNLGLSTSFLQVGRFSAVHHASTTSSGVFKGRRGRHLPRAPRFCPPSWGVMSVNFPYFSWKTYYPLI